MTATKVSSNGQVPIDATLSMCSDTKLTVKTTACVSERPFVAVR